MALHCPKLTQRAVHSFTVLTQPYIPLNCTALTYIALRYPNLTYMAVHSFGVTTIPTQPYMALYRRTSLLHGTK